MWEDDMVQIVRALVNDLDETAYTEDTLLKVLVVSARQVGIEMDFTQDFVADISNVAIAPDPTVTATKDDSYVNLVTLKAACIINQGAALLAAKQAIGVADGTSKIDLRDRSKALMSLLEKGWCAVYDDAKYEYKSGLTTIAGAAVMTPFRIYAQGNSAYGFGTQTQDRWGRSAFY